jgi:amino acid adenylation domain-containing protein
LNALDEDQRERALAGGRAMSVPSTDPSLYDLFHEQVDAHGNRPAVVGAGETLSYRELARRARGLARSLREAGVAPGDAVLVCLPPSPDQIVAILAIIESGGYYVPIDGRLPPARVAAVRAATSARIAVTDRPTGVAGIAIPISPDAAIEASATAPLDARRLASSVCYAMFTSGSTGVPKGVLVPDRAVIRLVRDQTFMRVTPEDVLVQISNFSFDAATLEIWGALLNGARVVIPGDNVVSDPLVLADMLELHSPTIGFFNVSLFRRVLDSRPAALRSYHTLLIGGEVVPESLVAAAARLLAPTALLNGYGPTENTTFSCVHRLIRAPEPRELFPIGRPIAHSTAYVTDAALRPSPPGALGEIVVGGAGLAYGYVNDLAATAERFVADPFSDAPGARLYRTGDFGRMRADGSILYVGRADDQVKIRGYRVQLQEIEMFVASVPGVRRAVAVTINHVHGVQLVAFAEADPRVTEHDIRAAVTRIAPHYAVPSQIVVLERFPTTPNGKVDRAALLTLRKSGVTTARGPTSDLEQRVAAIWRDLLGLEVIGVDSAFFEVGGDSLLLIVLRDRVEAEFGLLLPVTSLLEFTTIRTLAARLAGEGTRSDLAAHASARARRRAAFMNSRDASG